MIGQRDIYIKSEKEIALMREAGRINAMALAAVGQAIQPGVTTAELDAIAAEVLRTHAARPAFLGVPGAYPYPATTTISINEEMVHGIPGKRKLQEGDIVSVDCGTIFEGFVGDSAFTAGVGEVSSVARKLIEVTEKALYIGAPYSSRTRSTAPTAMARFAAVSTIFSCWRPKGTSWLISMRPAPVPSAYAIHM